jgi:chondroitin 4-sulfotransferase 11
MIVSDRTKCILVHIQRTGGASIENLLRSNDGDIGSHLYQGRRHMSAREVRALVGPEIWGGYFKFAFVRNPWDRLVSWYHLCTQSFNPNNFSRYIREHAPTFDDFVTKTTTGPAEKTTYNQLDYVTDENGEMMLDFVGRYEALHDEFSIVKARLNLSFELPHVNKSAHKDYREYYTEETREIVAQRFARDIAFFGYDF